LSHVAYSWGVGAHFGSVEILGNGYGAADLKQANTSKLNFFRVSPKLAAYIGTLHQLDNYALDLAPLLASIPSNLPQLSSSDAAVLSAKLAEVTLASLSSNSSSSSGPHPVITGPSSVSAVINNGPIPLSSLFPAAETPAGSTHRIDRYSVIYVQGPGSIVLDTQSHSAGSILKNLSAAEFATAFFSAGANPGVNEIAVVAFDDVGTSSNEADVTINVTSPAAAPQPINPNDHTLPNPIPPSQQLVAGVGGNPTLTSAFLNVTDSNSAHYTPGQLTYTITSAPSHGYLIKGGSIVSNFTQSDVNNGLIEYQENGTVASGDSFTYYVSDPAGNRSPNATFTLTINAPPISTHPTLDTNSSLSVGQGQTALITNSNLHVTDTGLNSWQIIYTVAGGATHGQILADGVNVVHSFTQQQVDLGLIQYQNVGNVSGADDLTFTVSDAVGGSIGQTTFGITVIPKNNLQVTVERPLYNDPGANTFPPSGNYTPWDVSALNTAVLTATDQGVNAANVVYTITSMPANTFFLVGQFGPGSAFTGYSSFTGRSFGQTDINNGFPHSFTQAELASGQVYFRDIAGGSGITYRGSCPSHFP
jgi:Cadherin-like